MLDLIPSMAVWLHGLPGEQCAIVPSLSLAMSLAMQGRIQDFGKGGGLINIFKTGGGYRRGAPPPVTARGFWGSADSSPSGVWGEAPARVAEGQPACQAGLTGQGPGLTCQARGLAYQAGPRPP